MGHGSLKRRGSRWVRSVGVAVLTFMIVVVSPAPSGAETRVATRLTGEGATTYVQGVRGPYPNVGQDGCWLHFAASVACIVPAFRVEPGVSVEVSRWDWAWVRLADHTGKAVVGRTLSLTGLVTQRLCIVTTDSYGYAFPSHFGGYCGDLEPEGFRVGFPGDSTYAPAEEIIVRPRLVMPGS